jgi:hypothetical protein
MQSSALSIGGLLLLQKQISTTIACAAYRRDQFQRRSSSTSIFMKVSSAIFITVRSISGEYYMLQLANLFP